MARDSDRRESSRSSSSGSLSPDLKGSYTQRTVAAPRAPDPVREASRQSSVVSSATYTPGRRVEGVGSGGSLASPNEPSLGRVLGQSSTPTRPDQGEPGPGPGVAPGPSRRVVRNLASGLSVSSRVSSSASSVSVASPDVGRSPPEVRDDATRHCKTRPTDNRKKGGGGNPRRFIPWCS